MRSSGVAPLQRTCWLLKNHTTHRTAITVTVNLFVRIARFLCNLHNSAAINQRAGQRP